MASLAWKTLGPFYPNIHIIPFIPICSNYLNMYSPFYLDNHMIDFTQTTMWTILP